MKRLFLCLIVYSVLVVNVVAGEPDKVFHEKCLYPTVMIKEYVPPVEEGEEECEAQPSGLGTGVIFKSEKDEKTGKFDNYVLSCAHVVQPQVHAVGGILTFILSEPPKYVVKKGNYKDWSTLVDFTDFTAQVVFQDVKADLAILYFESDEKMPVAELDLTPKLYIGNEVFRIGCGIGEPMKVDYGKITAVHHTLDERFANCYRTSVPTVMGDSGGPNFHDGYKCFGITQAVRGGRGEAKARLSEGYLVVPFQYFVYHISYVIPLDRIDVMAKAQKKTLVEKPVEAPKPEPVPPAPEPPHGG